MTKKPPSARTRVRQAMEAARLAQPDEHDAILLLQVGKRLLADDDGDAGLVAITRAMHMAYPKPRPITIRTLNGVPI